MHKSIKTFYKNSCQHHLTDKIQYDPFVFLQSKKTNNNNNKNVVVHNCPVGNATEHINT